MVQFDERYNRKDDSFKSRDPFESLKSPEVINVLSMVKGAERYVFLFTDERRAELLRLLGKFAANPQLSFTWYDAAVLLKKVRTEPPKNDS